MFIFTEFIYKSHKTFILVTSLFHHRAVVIQMDVVGIAVHTLLDAEHKGLERVPNEGAQLPWRQGANWSTRLGVKPKLDALRCPISENNGLRGAGIWPLKG